MKVCSIHSQKEIVDENAIIEQQKEEMKAIEKDERKNREDHIRSIDRELEELFAPTQVQEITSSISQVDPTSLSSLSLDILPSNQLANNSSQFLSTEERTAKEESLRIDEKLSDLSSDKEESDLIIPELSRLLDTSSNNPSEYPLDNSLANHSMDYSNTSSNTLSMSSSDSNGDTINRIFPPFFTNPAIPFDSSINAVEEKKPTALLYKTDSFKTGR